MKVLIVSSEVWKYDSNGGNVLSSIFKDTGFEFAQVFCDSGNPSNTICKKYLRITETSSLRSFFKKSDPFIAFDTSNSEVSLSRAGTDPLKEKFKFFKLPFFYLIREMLFNNSRWKKSKNLASFLNSFHPDIIFAPTYASPFMNKLSTYVSNICKVPVVSYISDDNYSLKQFRLSLFYWINRFWIRKSIRTFYKNVNLLYTMTEEQKEEIKGIFAKEIKILRKDYLFKPKLHASYNQISPRVIYAGGVYLKRYKNLLYIQKTGRKIFGMDFAIDVFTNCDSRRILKKLTNKGCRLYKSIPYYELMKKYQLYDIAIHTESFSLRERLLTRLSFSTKIIDCLSSGCATIAFLSNINSGYKFLKKNNLGVCCGSKKQLRKTFLSIENGNLSLESLASFSVNYCIENGLKERYSATIKKDFSNLMLEKSNLN